MERRQDRSEDVGIVRHFETLMDEGDYFFHVQKFHKAIECYSEALEIQPGQEHCLVARSRCYLVEGSIDNALADAELSLTNNPKNPKGVFQKAEVLYFKGEFEKSLLLFHRGHRARPEMEVFRLGIQKCEEAINNCVGDPNTIHLNLNCDLSYFFLNDENKIIKKQVGRISKKKSSQEIERRVERKPCNTNPKTIKQLLGELYCDREYLEKLLNDEESMDKKTQNSDEIRDIAVKGLNYLDERSNFWQQERPMYARRKHRISIHQNSSSAKSKQQSDTIKYVVSTLEEIDAKQSRSEHRKAIKQCTNLLKQMEKWSDNDLPNRLDIQANIYCLAGNSYLEMGNYDKALEFHAKDNTMGKKHRLEESISRSIDNLGRVYAKKGQFKKAIEIWKEKVEISKSALESTWLHHEMGRCYLELENYEMAMEYGEKSIDYAREAEDDTWKMNASILVAQAAVLSTRFSQAIEYFERALEYCKIMNNCEAEEAIKKAIVETNIKIIDESKEERIKGRDETDYGIQKEQCPDDKIENRKSNAVEKVEIVQDTPLSTENYEFITETNEIITEDECPVPIEDTSAEIEKVPETNYKIEKTDAIIDTTTHNETTVKRYSPAVSDIEEISIGGGDDEMATGEQL